MRFQSEHRVRPTFNLTPLIDILFIVLIFLVLTATFRDVSTLPVTLPDATSGERDVRAMPGVIAIAIAEDGGLAYDGDRLGMAELETRLRAIDQPELATVLLRADAGVSHGRVVQVLDALRRYDISQLNIQTRLSATGDR